MKGERYLSLVTAFCELNDVVRQQLNIDISILADSNGQRPNDITDVKAPIVHIRLGDTIKQMCAVSKF